MRTIWHSITVLAEILVVVLCLSYACQSAWSDDAVDRLSVPGPINFDGTSYQLTWSSHPSAYYYKQEYLPAGQTSEHFQRMVLLEAIVQGTDVSGAVSAQINPIAPYAKPAACHPVRCQRSGLQTVLVET